MHFDGHFNSPFHSYNCNLLFSLRNNNIGSKGAKFLAEALKMNQVLISLK